MTTRRPPELPDFVEPMLAKIGEPFDSAEHRFELKWDGFRCLVFIRKDGHTFLSRTRQDMTHKYPEFRFPGELPPGTVLDGELVHLVDGRPDFHKLLAREHARGTRKIAQLAESRPATFIAFDVLYHQGHSVMKRPLEERVGLLEELLEDCEDSRLVRSEGVVGQGLAFFDEVRRLGFEGMVAKRLGSAYLPGRRTDAWTKIKPVHELLCAIVGWIEEGGDVRSLVVAGLFDGELRCVGRVGSGLTAESAEELEGLCATRERDTPFVDCGGARARWLAPGLFCTVSYLEFTPSGNLRAPVFRELHIDP